MKRRNFIHLLPTVPVGLQMIQLTAPKPAFVIRASDDRFHEHLKVNDVDAYDCKVSGNDTAGAMSLFELTVASKGGPPLHIHPDQDEIFYIVEGEFWVQVGTEKWLLKAGDTAFAPRGVPHTFAHGSGASGKLATMFQPAGSMEDFFRAIAKWTAPPTPEAAQKLSLAHGMEVVGPRLDVE